MGNNPSPFRGDTANNPSPGYEWGPGICSAESGCRYYDGIAARTIGRQQAAQLAAILPAPLKRRPERMNNYSAIILDRMRQMGW